MTLESIRRWFFAAPLLMLWQRGLWRNDQQTGRGVEVEGLHQSSVKANLFKVLYVHGYSDWSLIDCLNNCSPQRKLAQIRLNQGVLAPIYAELLALGTWTALQWELNVAPCEQGFIDCVGIFMIEYTLAKFYTSCSACFLTLNSLGLQGCNTCMLPTHF